MSAAMLEDDERRLVEIGRRIATARARRGMTVADLAASACISMRAMERLESGLSVQMVVVVRCLRALELLGDLDRLAAPPPSAGFDVAQLRNGQQLSVAAAPGRRDGPWSFRR